MHTLEKELNAERTLRWRLICGAEKDKTFQGPHCPPLPHFPSGNPLLAEEPITPPSVLSGADPCPKFLLRFLTSTWYLGSPVAPADGAG